MSSFTYYAYGSNMLSTRLLARCPSARFIALAKASGYSLAFHKASVDESGKATLVAGDAGTVVIGALFEIDRSEMAKLDKAEGAGSGYDRIEEFRITRLNSKEVTMAVSYLASEDKNDAGLKPYDWYLALVLAGLIEHQIEDEYVNAIRGTIFDVDENEERTTRTEAIQALKLGGHTDWKNILSRE